MEVPKLEILAARRAVFLTLPWDVPQSEGGYLPLMIRVFVRQISFFRAGVVDIEALCRKDRRCNTYTQPISRTSDQTGLKYCTGVAMNSHGHLLVCSTFNNCVIEVDPPNEGGVRVKPPLFHKAHGKGLVHYPYCVSTAGDDRFVVADYMHDRIVCFSAESTVLWMSGRLKKGYKTKGEIWNEVPFSKPRACCWDLEGDVLALDSGKQTLRKLNGRTGEHIGDVYSMFENETRGVCVDLQGNIYVTEVNKPRCVKLSPKGELLLVIQHPHVKNPGHAACDAAGRLFIAASGGGLVCAYDTRNGKHLACLEVRGFERPWGVCISPDGKVIVGDTNSRVFLLAPFP